MFETSVTPLAVPDLPIGARAGKGRPQDHQASQPQVPPGHSSHSLPPILSTIFPLSSESLGATAGRAGGRGQGFATFYDPIFTVDNVCHTPIMLINSDQQMCFKVYRTHAHTFFSFIPITLLGEVFFSWHFTEEETEVQGLK